MNKTNMSHCKGCPIPMCISYKLPKSEGQLFSDPTLYRSTTGSLQYVNLTRPKIAFAVNKLSQYFEHPTVVHWSGCERLLRDLQATSNLGLYLDTEGRFEVTDFTEAY